MPKKRSERYMWMGITVFLLTAVVLVAFSPRVVAGNREEEREELLAAFEIILDFVQENYIDADKVQTRQLIEGALDGMFDSLDDPNSAYLPVDDALTRDLNDSLAGEFEGVGLVITKRDNARGAEVITPIQDTPAYRAGVSAADLIIGVDGEETADLDLDEIVKRLRGPRGTEVIMTILRGKALIFDVTVVRETIEYPSVKTAMIPNDVGYLRITRFTARTAERVSQALEEFQRNGYRSLIIDVRSNGGGRLDSVIDIADMILSDGVIVSTRSRVRTEDYVWYASRSDTLVPQHIPIVVIINSGSASASEILAGALKDTDRGTVIGETSYGKGTVQQVRHVGDFGFKLTTSKYYTPAGVSIDGTGIEPDVEILAEALSDEEQEAYDRLIGENRIKDFVKQYPEPSESRVTEFTADLRDEGIIMRERILGKLIRDEVNRTNNDPPVYDLEYDIVLQKAVEILHATR